jgi:hypothetical protein
MATVAGIIMIVMSFAAALLLYEATVAPPRNHKRDTTQRRERLRNYGLSAAIAALVAAYAAAIW